MRLNNAPASAVALKASKGYASTMAIAYKVNHRISPDQFVDVLVRSTLSERRPVDDRDCIHAMLEHGNLLVTAWHDAHLVGVARSLTDFNYICYLSDLAVDRAYQRQGIGKKLIEHSLEQLGPRCKMRLIAAPAAVDYYPKLGFSRNENCWEISRKPAAL